MTRIVVAVFVAVIVAVVIATATPSPVRRQAPLTPTLFGRPVAPGRLAIVWTWARPRAALRRIHLIRSSQLAASAWRGRGLLQSPAQRSREAALTVWSRRGLLRRGGAARTAGPSARNVALLRSVALARGAILLFNCAPQFGHCVMPGRVAAPHCLHCILPLTRRDSAILTPGHEGHTANHIQNYYTLSVWRSHINPAKSTRCSANSSHQSLPCALRHRHIPLRYTSARTIRWRARSKRAAR